MKKRTIRKIVRFFACFVVCHKGFSFGDCSFGIYFSLSSLILMNIRLTGSGLFPFSRTPEKTALVSVWCPALKRYGQIRRKAAGVIPPPPFSSMPGPDLLRGQPQLRTSWQLQGTQHKGPGGNGKNGGKSPFEGHCRRLFPLRNRVRRGGTLFHIRRSALQSPPLGLGTPRPWDPGGRYHDPR